MEVEPAAEFSATGARQTCQYPGLIATQPIPLTTPITDLWTDRSIAATPTEPAAARPKRRQNYIPGYASPRRAKGRRALIGRRDRARQERLSTANSGDKWAALTGLPMTEAHSRMLPTPIRAHSYRRTPATFRRVTRRGISPVQRAPA